jgi:hypothetical protein
LDEFLQARKALQSCLEDDKEAGDHMASVSGLAGRGVQFIPLGRVRAATD